MKKKDTFITNSAKQTQKLGEILAKELQGGEIVCLTGELGSGKTTFAQELLKALGAKGPFTSPTFVVMKQYKNKISNYKLQISDESRNSKSKFQKKYKTQNAKRGIRNIYHIDAYRVRDQDVLNLGWEEIISDKSSVAVVEWAERIKKIVPKDAVWIEFKHVDKNKRKIVLSNKVIGCGTSL